MQATEYIWQDGSFVPWDDKSAHVLTHSIHYGATAWEGLRSYATEKGPAIFRLNDHTKRFFYSASVINMELPYSIDEINEAICELVRKNEMEACYIRPVAYYGFGKMGVSPIGSDIHVALACWPWDKYLPYEVVDIKTTKCRKIPPSVTNPNAKIAGNYLNCVLAKLELKNTNYHEALLLDLDDFIAEGAGENFFMVKDNKVFTPKPHNILPGITRATIMEMIKDFGLEIHEKNITLDEAYQADECFFTGTAAEVAPIGTIDDHKIADGKIGPISKRLHDLYEKTVRGENEKMLDYLTFLR